MSNYNQPQYVQYTGPSQEDRNFSMLCHLSGIFAAIILPLVIWLVKKDDSVFIDYHAKQALNFQISMLIYIVISCLLMLIIIGVFLLIALVFINIIYSIIAALKANNGEYYEYPLAIKFLS